MANTYNVEGIILNPVNSMLGRGGQGVVEQVALSGGPSIALVLKRLPMTAAARAQTKALVDLCLSSFSPFLDAPIVANMDGTDEIVHLAPMALGVDLENDDRTFAESMETAFHLSSLVEILEEQGVAHGDLAPSNIIIETDGSVHLIDFDNASSAGSTFPAATMAGQPMMLAPEIRLDKQKPNIESDRYALAVLLNMVLLRRHPADGQALVPSDMDSVMASGRWPERDRAPEPTDVPLTALGDRLCELFDRAFLIEPTQRPSANAWRQALGQALHAMVVHDCGNAFVHDKTQARCPWCQVSVEAKSSSIATLKITVPKTGARYSLALQDGESTILGRQNLGGQMTVSGRHLELTPMGDMGDKVLLRHIGRHPTSILKDGQWYNLQELWVDTDDLAMAPIALQLADLHIDIGL